MKLNDTWKFILVGVANGQTNAEIAKTTGLSMRTVETYRLRAMVLLGLKSTADVVKWAIKNRLTSLDGVGRYDHWVYSAAEACRPFLRKIPTGKGSCHREHISSMIREVARGEFTSTKACRWLGWIQAAIVFGGAATLADMKAINRAASERLGGGKA